MIRLPLSRIPVACRLCQRPLSKEAVNALRLDSQLVAVCGLCSIHNPLCADRRLLPCRPCREIRYTLEELDGKR